MPTADPQLLRALVTAVRHADDARMAMAIRAEPTWTGPGFSDHDVPVRVVGCASPLAVRAALADHEQRNGAEILAMLTSCTDSELGPDLLARLAKGRVLSIDPYTALLGLFGASVLDPALTRNERWLIDELIEIAPPGGWPNERLIGSVLDIDTAWQVWHRVRLGIPAVPETLDEVLRLADAPGVAAKLASLPAMQRARIATRWMGGAAPSAVLVELFASGGGPDALPLGVVVDVLWAVTDDPVLAQHQMTGRVRLENVLGRENLDERSARAWEQAAMAIVSASGVATVWLDRAERLLADAGVAPLAVLSDYLRTGFELRLDAFAGPLAARDLTNAKFRYEQLSKHRDGGAGTRRLAAAAAAVRLLRRAGERRADPSSFYECVQRYADDGAWVDEARRVLAEGDQSVLLAAAYTALCAELDDERRRGDVDFGRRLAEWTASEAVPHAEVVTVERLLEDIVRPIATEVPVLVLVCDGMSLPVAHELIRDLAEKGWTPAVPADRDRWPVGISMLPTITEVSRTSLFTGRRIEGAQAEEKAGFAAHPGLRAASVGMKPPVLFHKAQLIGPSGQALPDDVRIAMSDPTQRVIGVVVNSVDDHLAKGQQVRVSWGLESLGPLKWLLDAAIEAERIIILTADHGHVIHGDGAELRASGEGGGERWRTHIPEAAPDEVEVSGPRVLKGGRVVLAVDERIRYAGYKHGYHGGASLQEVLVPVVALARVLPEGWTRRPLTPPNWWSGDIVPVAVPAAPSPVALVTGRSKRKANEDQASLFAEQPTAPAGNWVDALIASPIFEAQRERIRLPRPIATERIRGYLAALHANGGTIELSALAGRVGEPADQLRMALTLVQRLINIDGSEILAVRGNSSVELNTELLRLQYEIDVP